MLKRFFLFALIAAGCSGSEESTLKQLNGHWHALNVPWDIKTLDVFDSVTFIDHYSLLGYGREFALYDQTGKVALPDLCGGEGISLCIDKYYFLGDTLVYDTTNSGIWFPFKFVRSNLELCRWSDALDRKFIELSEFPLQSRRLMSADSAKRISRDAVIMVGLSKDSIKTNTIQVSDVFISIKDIPMYVSRSADLGHTNRSNFAVCLIIDQRVRKSFADSVVNAIPKSDSIKLYRMVSVKDSNVLGYERVN